MSESVPQAVVLCGGLGTRLRPAVGDLPKALAPVGDRPFIDYLMQYLAAEGVNDVVLCTGYGVEQIKSYCGDGSRWGVHIAISNESAPLGTGGAVKNAESFINSDPFFVLNGDSFVRAPLKSIAAHHRPAITMVLTEVDDKSRFGSVRMGTDGAVEGFSEKGEGGRGLINAGIYLMNRDVLDHIAGGVAVSMEREILPRYVGRGLHGFVVPGPFIDIGTPESFMMAADVL